MKTPPRGITPSHGFAASRAVGASLGSVALAALLAGAPSPQWSAAIASTMAPPTAIEAPAASSARDVLKSAEVNSPRSPALQKRRARPGHARCIAPPVL